MLIRQQAFTGLNGHFLKGGLHCHTTRSDGKLSPEETIRLHAENGYDFLALTDHRYYNFENYAPDSDVRLKMYVVSACAKQTASNTATNASFFMVSPLLVFIFYINARCARQSSA